MLWSDPVLSGANAVVARELDCLTGILGQPLLQAASLIARETGTGADQVLIRRGVIDEATYLAHLARYSRVAITSLTDARRSDTPATDAQLTQIASTGMLPLRIAGEMVWCISPRHFGSRGFMALLDRTPDMRSRLRLTSSACLQQFLTHAGHDALAHHAVHALADRDPAFSAAEATPDQASRNAARACRASCVAALLVLPPLIHLHLASLAVSLLFLAFFALRLAGCFRARPETEPLPRMNDRDLPHYTVMVALYREAASVGPLINALSQLDYPREKLDIILVIEPDDLQTRAAIAKLGPRPDVQVIIATPDAPQTKPKALNFALPFARGAFVAVYDAEDLPEPGQLRAALDTFRRHGPDVVCAQAALCIDNDTHSLFSRMFAAEYAGQFDVYLPGMAQMKLPLPLGGTSNHFRTQALREVGSWDAFNVTEDADLGFRLARFGYRSVTFQSSTFEEAPIHFKIWLKQRSRWMKGWFQTWQVHMRQPVRTWREMNPAGFLTMNILIGGNLLSALVYPVMVLMIAYSATLWALGYPRVLFQDAPTAIIQTMHGTVFLGGIATTVITLVLGMKKRRRPIDWWLLASIPLYWGFLSLAAWRALLQYIWTPFHWEKTEHGTIKRRSMPASQISSHTASQEHRNRAAGHR